MTLALSAAVAPDDTVTVRYVKPTTGTGNKLQDASGNEVRDLPLPGGGPITRRDTTAPALDGNPAVDGVTLVLTFDEALAAASGLANSAFTVKVGGSFGGSGRLADHQRRYGGR